MRLADCKIILVDYFGIKKLFCLFYRIRYGRVGQQVSSFQFFNIFIIRQGHFRSEVPKQAHFRGAIQKSQAKIMCNSKIFILYFVCKCSQNAQRHTKKFKRKAGFEISTIKLVLARYFIIFVFPKKSTFLMIPQVKTQFSLCQKNILVIETFLWKSDVPKNYSAIVRFIKSYFENFIVNVSLGRFYQ